MDELLTYRMEEDRVVFAYRDRLAFVPRALWPKSWFLGDFHPDLEAAIRDWFVSTDKSKPSELDLEDVVARLLRM